MERKRFSVVHSVDLNSLNVDLVGAAVRPTGEVYTIIPGTRTGQAMSRNRLASLSPLLALGSRISSIPRAYAWRKRRDERWRTDGALDLPYVAERPSESLPQSLLLIGRIHLGYASPGIGVRIYSH
jgi:hypothetical protein